ncbi:bis(5'-adenosyl)-triphosphatase Nit1 [Schizosaccharomyces pombe]|uniref:Probable hydrolase nit2 n=1 Tax=Schizosaccharomyces pombe (strain 972 / ATCC 24843) TaxID=284812 RepID=NIT2_SCHPO|nr:nitrilase superfamily protein [Schizosaccharomyces pombe]O94660.1 RecName: Full=Probable hydrolase nit2 [Schizosaccharomyces pombe 972h-]CAB37598.1 bis(5'-adenosyl)-triphosphatase (predicted) [Schizosaccharomyces pombe]|eukprot:NP_595500.1 nitrilase superfamily protein [Schizosaccharomyces pombe]
MTLAAVAQLNSSGSILKNLAICKELISQAAAKGAKCIFFPEASDFIAHNSDEAIELTNHPDCSKFIRDVRESATKHSIFVNICVHEPSKVKNKLLNSSLFIEPLHGEIISRYSKAHLFDVEIKNGPTLKESNTTLRGEAILPPCKTPLGKVGSAICFDIRFPEQAIKLRNMGAHIITYPSAFTEKTGAAHWEVLLRARALDSQCYVIAPAQGGKHNEKRASYGHSMIVDPWGTVIAQYSDISSPNGLIFADLDLNLVDHVRTYIPLLRRNDLYPTI